MIFILNLIDRLIGFLFAHYMFNERVNWIKYIFMSFLFTTIEIYLYNFYPDSAFLQTLIGICINSIFLLIYFKKYDFKSISISITLEIMYYFCYMLVLLIAHLLQMDVFDIITVNKEVILFFILMKLINIVLMHFSLRQLKSLFELPNHFNYSILCLADVFILCLLSFAQILIENN